MGSEESTREEVACGGNEDVKMSGVTKLDRIRIIKGTMILGEISKKVQESRLKWYGHVRKRRRIRRQESDGDGGAGEKKERKTKAEVVG